MRNRYLDAVKGMTMIFVVYFHAVQCVNVGVCGCVFNQFFEAFNMPIFFAVSGFIAFSSHKRGVFDSLVKKIIRLLLPTIMWIGTHYLLRVALDCDRLSFAGAIDWLVMYGFWFLRTLFVIFVLHDVSLAILRVRGAEIFFPLGVVFCALAINPYANIAEHPLAPTQLFYYWAFFEMGWLFSLMRNRVTIGVLGNVTFKGCCIWGGGGFV